jgi:uncharacterized membrane protein
MMVGLSPPKNCHATHAFDVSADAAWIVGYAVGSDPKTMVPCAWRHHGHHEWIPETLTSPLPHNPFLLGGRVIVSDDGRQIAACLSVDAEPNGIRFQNALFRWTRQGNEPWQRTKWSDTAMRLGGMNNAGLIVGSCNNKHSRRACLIEADGQLTVLEAFVDNGTSEALDINNDNIIVGYHDDLSEATGGPQAIIWKDKQPMRLQAPQGFLYSWAAAINDNSQIAGYIVPEVEKEDVESSKTVSFICSGCLDTSSAANSAAER